MIDCWLQNKGASISNQTVSVTSNGTLIGSGLTGSNGHFEFAENFNPSIVPTSAVTNNTCDVEATFAGDGYCNSTAIASALDGTSSLTVLRARDSFNQIPSAIKTSFEEAERHMCMFVRNNEK